MPDMDGFKLLEHVGLEMDLPVIMMSVDGETSRVMKGVQHGACDYLLKPIRMKELRNIWQHVYRKRAHELKGLESHEINDDIQILRDGLENFDDKLFVSTSEMMSLGKRKDLDTREFSYQDFYDSTTVKKSRVVWSLDLHQKFVNAVDQIGFDKVGPKKILDLMNVPGLTRENIASHLQKYRMYLSRIQKQNEAGDFAGNMQPDHSSVNHSGSVGCQNSRTFNENSGVNSYGQKSQNFHGQDIIQYFQKSELNKAGLLSVKDKEEVVTADIHFQKTINASQPEQMLRYKGLLPHSDPKQVYPSISKRNGWHGSVLLRQFLQYPKHNAPFSLLEHSSHSSQTQEPQIALWKLQCPSLFSVGCSKKKDETKFDVKPSITNCNGHLMKILSEAVYEDDPLSTQVEQANSKEFEATYEHKKLISLMEHHYEQSSVHDLILPTIHLDTKNEASLIASSEDLNHHSLHGFGCLDNVCFNGMELHQLNGCASPTELQSNCYDEIEFNCEYWYDPLDCPLLDEGLFV